MADIEFAPAAERSSADLAALFTRGYDGYFTPVTLNAAEFENMVRASDLDLAASRLVLVDGVPVAFALLGVRGAHGWVGGMGVVPEWRGRGLGRRIMERLIAAAREAGIADLDLEVLEQNAHAARIYEALGFRDLRKLDVWVRDPAPLAAGAPAAGEHGGAPTVLAVADCLELHPRYHATRRPWQRDLDSLRHWSPRLSAAGVRDARGVAGWVIYRLNANRLNLADLAVRPRESVLPVTRALAALIERHPGATTMLVNLPEGDPLAASIQAVGATVRLRQREMSLRL